MPRPPSPQERQQAQDEARRQAGRQAATAARRRKRLVAVIGLLLVVALVAGLVGALVSGGSSDPTTTRPSTTTTPTSSTVPPVSLTPVAPGATLTGATPCPAEDGSSPRTTSFAGPPPTCIDLGYLYQAVVHTTVGDITLQLNTAETPTAVNNFVVLSRYHYYDGQPFSPIVTKTLAGVEAGFAGTDRAASPGYELPSEVPPQGQLAGAFTVAFIPLSDTGAYDAPFFIATFGGSVQLDTAPTVFAMVLDGEPTIQAIDAAGSSTGRPTQEILITSIDVTRSVPVG